MPYVTHFSGGAALKLISNSDASLLKNLLSTSEFVNLKKNEGIIR